MSFYRTSKTMNDDDPMDSPDPAVRKKEIDSTMAFVEEEMRKDRERMQAQTLKALAEQRAPLMMGGVDAGGLTSAG